MGAFGHRLVIGPGGSGTTHRLASWVAEVADEGAGESDEAGPEIVEVRGDPVVPPAPGVIDRVVDAATRDGVVVVAHDVHWLADGLLIALVHATESVDVWASRRPWPVSDLVRTLDDRLTSTRPADRLGSITTDELAPIVARRTGRAARSDHVEALHRLGAGLVGPICDALDEGLALGSSEALDASELASSPGLRDRALRRIGRAGRAAGELVRVLVVEPTLDRVIADRLAVEGHDGCEAGDALRAARAGGLLDGADDVIPLMAAAVRSDMTTSEVAAIHLRLADVLAGVDRRRAIDHAVAASSVGSSRPSDLIDAVRADVVTDPVRARHLLEQALLAGADPTEVAVLEAELHLRAGRTEAIGALGRITDPGPFDREVRALQIAIEMRAGRWDRVTTLAGPATDTARPVAALAAQLTAAATSPERAGVESDRSDLVERLTSVLTHLLAARHTEALQQVVEAADDEVDGADVRLDGVAATTVASLLAVLLGELATADALLGRSLTSGRPASELAAIGAMSRYVALRRSRSTSAMADGTVQRGEAPGEGEPVDPVSGWTRDVVLHAAVEAAVARRVADPARLRAAWEIADPVLVRTHASWLFLEPLTELVVLGARLDHTGRVEPIVDALTEQVSRAAAPEGAVVASLGWLQLNVALAAGDDAGARAAVATLRASAGHSLHARARAEAGEVWLQVAAGIVDEAQVVHAVDALIAVEEGWEAARLAGQAALDATDPQVTKRLLERARAAAPDPTPARSPSGDADGLVTLGLSEREAEVARLVADGRTHKEIGAELYISAKTVEHHVARARQKLGAANRAELLAIVRDNPVDGR